MNTFKQLLNECIENEASYFRNGEKKQEVIDYVEALERKIAQLEAQIGPATVVEELTAPVLVELVEVEEIAVIEKSGEPEYEASFSVQGFGGFGPSTFTRRFRARDFLSANGAAHTIRDNEFGGRDNCRIVMIRELE